MSGSHAGVMKVGPRTVLGANTGTAAYTTPLTGYGVTGVNDTGPIPLMVEGKGFKEWTFEVIGGGTGYSYSVYYTVDPVAYKVWVYARNPNPSNIFAAEGITLTSLPATSWSLMPGPSEQTGEGGVSNPITGGVTSFLGKQALIGIRVVLTGSAAPAGVTSVVAFAVP